MDNTPIFTVTDFLAVCNQTLNYSFSQITIEGEVMSFKVNQGKWVFFDLKDETSSLGCFLPLYQLRLPLEDGMKVLVKGTPKVTPWGKFSFTVSQILPKGTGSIKKSFELLKQKLTKEGLFDPAKKRPLPPHLRTIGVISSTAAAGYADFIKILNARWSGLQLQVAHTAVQGLSAPDQIIRALNYFNEHATVDVIAILRGGGSADDLAAFNDELLARTIAASRIPVITGIGHEVDESLADLAADLRASTPSNAAELLTPDRTAELANLRHSLSSLQSTLTNRLHQTSTTITSRITDLAPLLHRHLAALDPTDRITALPPLIYRHLATIDPSSRTAGLSAFLHRQVDSATATHTQQLTNLRQTIHEKLHSATTNLQNQRKILTSLNPDLVLARGYAIITGEATTGNVVKITTLNNIITAEVKHVKTRSTH